MKIKTLFLFILIVISSNSAHASPIIIKFSHVVAQNTPKGQAATYFKKLAEERTNGAVKVEVYPNSQLYKDKEEMEALQLGAVQMLAPSLNKFSPLGLKEFELFDLPFIFDNYAELHEVTQGSVGAKLLKKLEPKGIIGLAYWDNGFKVMSANKPLKVPDDFNGLKMRIQSSKVLDSQMRSVGATPQVMAFSEVYQALQTGVADGTENPPSNLYYQKFHEVQKYITVSNHGYMGYAVIVNKKFWLGLPADIRTTLEEAMKDATNYANDLARENNEEALTAVKRSGRAQLINLTPHERAAWKKSMEISHKDNIARIGFDLVKEVYAATDRAHPKGVYTQSAQAEIIADAETNRTIPVITITTPAVKRGVKVVARDSSVTVTGKVIDTNGVAKVEVNGQTADLDGEGNFAAEVLLRIGENKITVAATNIHKNTATERFTLVREASHIAKAKPEILMHSLTAGNNRYFALIIGNNNYIHLEKLKTAVNDATAIEKTLKGQYGFQTKLLLNATRKEILSTINDFRKLLKEQDNLLIYYAGHGEFEKTAGKAYWLPVDAQTDDPAEWIIADDITSSIKRISSRHVLVVSDSCYSGTLTRSAQTNLNNSFERDEFLKKMNERLSRTLMASGGNEPVADGGGSGHSIFADSFLKALREIDTPIFTADELFHKHIKSRVAGRSEQVPEYNQLRNSGDEGGDFVFMKQR